VQVELSGDVSHIVSTDVSEYYEFTNLAGGGFKEGVKAVIDETLVLIEGGGE